MANIELTCGQIGFNDKKELKFPPENAKKTQTPKKNFIEIALMEEKNKGLDR